MVDVEYLERLEQLAEEAHQVRVSEEPGIAKHRLVSMLATAEELGQFRGLNEKGLVE